MSNLNAVEKLETTTYADAYDFSSVQRAQQHPLFSRLRPLGLRLLVTRPHPRLSHQLARTRGGIFKPQRSERATSKSYGLVCTVLTPACDLADQYPTGSRILVEQWAGTAVYDMTDGIECEMWIVGASDVLATLEDLDQWQQSVQRSAGFYRKKN